MKTTNQALPPASTMPMMVTPDSSMLDMIIWRRPHLSERCPPMGAAMKPATCSTVMQVPIATGEYPIS